MVLQQKPLQGPISIFPIDYHYNHHYYQNHHGKTHTSYFPDTRRAISGGMTSSERKVYGPVKQKQTCKIMWKPGS